MALYRVNHAMKHPLSHSLMLAVSQFPDGVSGSLFKEVSQNST
jgi:hypothetical protein